MIDNYGEVHSGELVIIIRYPASPSRIIVLLNVDHYSCYKIKTERKKRVRDKKG